MASLLTQIRFLALNDANLPAAGWKVWTYAAGTATPKATYTDSSAGTPNSNPVVLNSRGEATIWLSGTYKIVLTTDADVVKNTEDNVSDGTTNGTFTNATFAGTLTISSTAVTWSGNPTHSGNHTFSGNVTVNGNTTLGNAAGDALTIAPNAVTWSNNPTHSGNHTWSGNQTINGTLATTGNNTLGNALGDTLSVAADAWKVHSDGRVSGNKLHNIGTVTGTTDQFVASGTYTPTLTNGTNVAASSASISKWMRLGNFVRVSGLVDIDPTATGTTITSFSLPIASSLAATRDLTGGAHDINPTGQNGGISADGANDRAIMSFNATTAAYNTWTFHFDYEVL